MSYNNDCILYERYELEKDDEVFATELRAERSAEIMGAAPFMPPGEKIFMNDEALAACKRRREAWEREHKKAAPKKVKKGKTK